MWTPFHNKCSRKHQHLTARTRVVQCNGMRRKILRVRPSLQPALRPRGGRNSAVFSHAFRPPRSTRHQFFEKQAQEPFAAARYATSSWLGKISSVPQRSQDASYQTNLANVRDHATHAPVSTPYHTTRSHGRKRYTCEQPQIIPHLSLIHI